MSLRCFAHIHVPAPNHSVGAGVVERAQVLGSFEPVHGERERGGIQDLLGGIPNRVYRKREEAELPDNQQRRGGLGVRASGPVPGCAT